MKISMMMAMVLAATLPLTTMAAKKKAAAPAKAESFAVNAGESKVTWEASKITKATHTGTVGVKSGHLSAVGEKLTGGEFEIDMKSIKDTDLTDPEMNKKLVGHLNSDDFFATDKFATSKFVITKVEDKDGKHMITGDLSIKGTTAPVTFPADVKVTPSLIEAKGKIAIDRTKYNVRYNSVKFFSNLGDKVINDEFTVNVDIKATK